MRAAAYIARQPPPFARQFEHVLSKTQPRTSDEEAWVAVLRTRLAFDHEAGPAAIKAAGELQGLPRESECIAAQYARADDAPHEPQREGEAGRRRLVSAMIARIAEMA